MNDIIDMTKMLENFVNLGDSEHNKVSSTWKKVVSRIKSIEDRNKDLETVYEGDERELSLGERLAQNTHVVDLKKSVLLVEANHSGWIQYLRMYQKFILKGLQMESPELNIKTLAFRTRGSDVSLYDGYEEELEKALKKRKEELEKSEKEIKEFFSKNDSEEEREKNRQDKNPSSEKINPELKAKIDELYETFKESMLTNTKK